MRESAESVRDRVGSQEINRIPNREAKPSLGAAAVDRNFDPTVATDEGDRVADFDIAIGFTQGHLDLTDLQNPILALGHGGGNCRD